jgi:hypothetical protein
VALESVTGLAEVFTTAERTRERKRARQRMPALNMTARTAKKNSLEKGTREKGIYL